MDFALEWRGQRTVVDKSPFAIPQTSVRFLDYVIDGESLSEQHGLDWIGPLGYGPTDWDEEVARRLLLEEESDMDDRVAVYVCKECGDVDCGGITAVIERAGDEFVWRDLAVSRPEWDDEGTWRHDFTGLEKWSELRFPADAYCAAILNRPKTTWKPPVV